MSIRAAALLAFLSPAAFGAPAEGDHPSLTSDGLIQDAGGALLKIPEARRTVLVAGRVFGWDKERGWGPKGPLGDAERAAVRRAVEEFNKLELSLKLDYAESDDAGLSLANLWRNRDKLVVYWAEDAPEGGLGRPYQWRGGSYITGCSTVIRDRDGRHSYRSNAQVPEGAEIAGGMMFMVELTPRLRTQFKCKEDGPVYVALHELGHCLGLGHRTPAPSIMHGTCGTAYLPNDADNFRRLYGAK